MAIESQTLNVEDDLRRLRNTVERLADPNRFVGTVEHKSQKPNGKWKVEGKLEPPRPRRRDGSEWKEYHGEVNQEPDIEKGGLAFIFGNPDQIGDRVWIDSTEPYNSELANGREQLRKALTQLKDLDGLLRTAQEDADKNKQLREGAERLSRDLDRVKKQVEKDIERAEEAKSKVKKDRDELAGDLALVKRYRPLLAHVLPPPEAPSASGGGLNITVGERILAALESAGITKGFAVAYILSLLTALANRRFLLLAGHVGVGKSRLLTDSGSLLGGKTDPIAVRPGWLDPSDLLGYFDPLAEGGAGAFRDSPFTEALREISQAGGDLPNLVLLDEMNIARVENYAADLLATLGTEEESISLYGGNDKRGLVQVAKEMLKDVPDNALRESLIHLLKPFDRTGDGRLPIPKTAVFCGTLNVDGWTEELSPKMIDRSFLLRFPRPDLSKSSDHSDRSNPISISVVEVKRVADEASKGEPEGWSEFYGHVQRVESCLIPLSRRVYDDYATFITLGRKLGIEDLDELQRGFAFARIFPRIRIDSKQAKRHKGILVDWLGTTIKPGSQDAINEAANKLLQMLDLDESHVSYQQVCG